ncbi:unnamed protein product, partial [marine sediment metagenome]
MAQLHLLSSFNCHIGYLYGINARYNLGYSLGNR